MEMLAISSNNLRGKGRRTTPDGVPDSEILLMRYLVVRKNVEGKAIGCLNITKLQLKLLLETHICCRAACSGYGLPLLDVCSKFPS